MATALIVPACNHKKSSVSLESPQPQTETQSETSNFPKVLYVDSASGLRGYAEPSTNGRIVKTLLHGERIVVNNRNSMPVTIDGITDYWYKRSYAGGGVGEDIWIFGGFLSESFPLLAANYLQGGWHFRNITESCYGEQHYIFAANGIYVKGAIYYGREHFGEWSSVGNMVTIQFQEYNDYGWGGEHKIDHIRYITVNPNNANLIFQDESILELVRCNDPGWWSQ
jgi:hypothetical protein